MRLIFFLVLLIKASGYAESAVAASQSTEKVESSLEKQRKSIEDQRVSLRQQVISRPDTANDYFITPMTFSAQGSCSSLTEPEIAQLIDTAAQKQSIEPEIIRAVMKQESGFRPCAASNKGAQGLMQLMPSTAMRFHVSDPFDPQQNVQAGAALLKELLNRYDGDLKLTLAAYNAGSTRVLSQVPDIVETRQYVASIMAELGKNHQDNSLAESSDVQLPPARLQ